MTGQSGPYPATASGEVADMVRLIPPGDVPAGTAFWAVRTSPAPIRCAMSADEFMMGYDESGALAVFQWSGSAWSRVS